jgi:hypothetical protein
MASSPQKHPLARLGHWATLSGAAPTIAVDRDVLRVHGEVRQITRIGDQFRAVIEIREALQ